MKQDLPQSLRTVFDAQRSAFAEDSFPDLSGRLERLARLEKLLRENEDAFAEAISADFGNRSKHETLIAETLFTLASISHVRKHLKRWMKPRRVGTTFHSLPGTSRIIPQPLGVIGIVSPWNYPLQLALAPAVAAIAAGNRVLIKPSELTPKFSDLLARLIADYFSADECAVVTGDAEVAKAFVSLPFDHLFFTGSTAVGKHVGMAAAANLTPVTLELGGKSPAIVDASCDLKDAAVKIAAGKLFNAGQTCIAPDYVLVPAAKLDHFVQAFTQATQKLYPTLEHNPDYTSIVNERHFARLTGLLEDARANGASLNEINPGAEIANPATRKMRPTLVLGATPAMRIMQDEIFGPLLPVLPYESVDDAIAFVNARPRPLALYWFGKDSTHRDKVLHETISGGVTINDALYHIAQENLPFGGVGDSGSGAYHGEYGFRLFTKEKPVFEQSALSGTGLLRPPFGKLANSIIRTLKRVI
ncbi:MAG: coniferyl aldehyde dehydrogenase [Gammaproteobacteria bacterium]|jgi:coniferyl-aldehyde dehydrogenase|nr:coniferyl aldehyde dehydrogenase [Gammaproteobacteria bacterium]MBU0786467.1 coniferyl aldehyde dehydrogenase [Gammaproteobacteria bacterium]MBU0816170.1 coniferyl aldehyde dehydrogenase [Gammaproteobacteria bacterium]MBU1787804.1 coniferyl aldehyde dehydrogenase [Gammaproteobacteria bacterium]